MPIRTAMMAIATKTTIDLVELGIGQLARKRRFLDRRGHDALRRLGQSARSANGL
jgi:hypothetical protein